MCVEVGPDAESDAEVLAWPLWGVAGEGKAALVVLPPVGKRRGVRASTEVLLAVPDWDEKPVWVSPPLRGMGLNASPPCVC